MKVVKLYSFLMLSLFFTMCSNNPVKPPERHSAIPKEAIWYGGADGGAWITVNEGDSINLFKVKVYNENDGSLWADVIFTVSNNCSDTVLNVEGVRQSINFYDGEIIGLTNIRKGKYCGLVPVKK
jgi:hypothetical protein